MNWRAILYGFLASIAIGLVSGLGLPFTDATLPVIGAGLAGLIAGAVAGYVNNWTLGSDALHGGVATVVGALVVVAVLTFVGTLAAGVFGLGLGLALLVMVAVTAIPGAVGGAIGGYLHGGRGDDTTRTAA